MDRSIFKQFDLEKKQPRTCLVEPIAVLVVLAISGYILITYLHSKHDHGHDQLRGGGKNIEVDGPRDLFVCGNGLLFARVRPQLSRRSTNTEQTWSLLEHSIWKIIIKIIFYLILIKNVII